MSGMLNGENWSALAIGLAIALAIVAAAALASITLNILLMRARGRAKRGGTSGRAQASRAHADTAQSPGKILRSRGPYAHYAAEVRVNPAARLPAPAFVSPAAPGEFVASLRPTFEVRPPEHLRSDNRTIYYFEIDVVDSFDSPNLVRMPMLIRVPLADDLTSPRGMWFHLFRSQHRWEVGGGPRVQLPFRASAMRLPLDRALLDAEELQRHAAALGWGLAGQALVEELFSFTRFVYPINSDTHSIGPDDLFRRGVGGCGHINGLLAEYLELNGLRTRGVSGHYPRVKPIKPGGGHTAIEVFREVPHSSGRWEYVDAYLDTYLPGTSARDIGLDRRGPKLLVYRIPDQFDHAIYGDAVYLQNLFEERRYFDRHDRRRAIAASDGDESRYGLDWPLRTPARWWTAEELFPPSVRLHVRCRYVTGPDVAISAKGSRHPAPRNYRLSEWQVTHINVDLSESRSEGVRDGSAAAAHARAATTSPHHPQPR